MKFTKKLTVTLTLVVVCLVLAIWATYAWFVLSSRPEVQRMETNVGANGSLEIALLNKETFEDPSLIRTTVGDSAVKQNVKESNLSWGNVIHLDYGYGLDEITLKPARLNVTKQWKEIKLEEIGQELAEAAEDASEDAEMVLQESLDDLAEVIKEEVLVVDQSMLKTAAFGIDGRIKVLEEETVSAIWDWDGFTYQVAGQRYGVRGIGTISHLTKQQTTMAQARSLAKAYTSAAARMAESTWSTYGGGIMDLMYRLYALDERTFTEEDVALVRAYTDALMETVEYVDAAMRYSLITYAAACIVEEPDFEGYCKGLLYQEDGYRNDTNNFALDAYLDWEAWERVHNDTLTVDWIYDCAENAVGVSYYFANDRSRKSLISVLDWVLPPDSAYLGDKLLEDPDAYASVAYENELLVKGGLMEQIARAVGNYSASTVWRDGIHVSMKTASPETWSGILVKMQTQLDEMKASTGGWTRNNLDDVYGFAVDLAFRCNEPSDLQLQTDAVLRTPDDSEYPATQGGGSYMIFSSDNMEEEQLINLMDTLRVAFVNDLGEVLGVAKPSMAGCYMNEYGEVHAPLYLYEHTLDENGKLTLDRIRKDAGIMALPQNTPMIVSVVVWLDGDHVDNGMVSDMAQQSMQGLMNLQFSSSADLVPSKQPIE